MAKKVVRQLKLQIPAGKANPAPPVGPALGQAQVNIPEFIRQFNERTQDQMGYVVPVIISVYEDRTFSFVVKTPPASDLLKKACKIEKGSGEPDKKQIAKIKRAELIKLAEMKLKDLNAYDAEHATKILEGTAKSMGIVVED